MGFFSADYYGMLDIIENRPEKLNGGNFLFIHTGGTFGLFADKNVGRLLEGRF